MRFAIVGMGFVGQAVYSVLSDKHDVVSIDPGKIFGRPEHYASLEKLLDHENHTRIHSDGFVICVPTPQADNGRCDDILVTEYVNAIRKYYPRSHILIKSTTSIETLGKWKLEDKVTFSPEFLSSETSVDTTQQFRDVKFAIYGGKGGRWWHEVFKQLQDIQEVRFLDIESAGFLKYTENAFLATKVMFFNELKELWDATQYGNWDTMIEALALDKRIGMSHTQVPGPDGLYGFGGHCLPKDTSEFLTWSQEQQQPLEILKLVRHLNNTHYRDK